MSSGKSSEDSSVAKILFFDGFDSGLILSSNGLNESYVEYAQKTRNQSNVVVFAKNAVFCSI